MKLGIIVGVWGLGVWLSVHGVIGLVNLAVAQ